MTAIRMLHPAAFYVRWWTHGLRPSIHRRVLLCDEWTLVVHGVSCRVSPPRRRSVAIDAHSSALRICHGSGDSARSEHRAAGWNVSSSPRFITEVIIMVRLWISGKRMSANARGSIFRVRSPDF